MRLSRSILGEGESEDFLGSILGESEDEFEGEDEGEISPIRKIYPDAVMEHLGELAAESESEDEAAEHFLPLIGMAASKLLPVVAKAIAPTAKRALPKIARVLTRATPKLTRGIGKVAKVLHRNPQTRHLLRACPVSLDVQWATWLIRRRAERTLRHTRRCALSYDKHAGSWARRNTGLKPCDITNIWSAGSTGAWVVALSIRIMAGTMAED